MYEDRVERAVALFRSGYNCSQSVVAAFADLYGFTFEQALRMSASFGAGIGRMRLTCGTACGLFQLLGLDVSAVEGADRAAKAANYRLVQRYAERLRAINGSITCSELLGLRRGEGTAPEPEARTAAYYEKRPCPRLVETAARLFAEYLEEKARGAGDAEKS